MLRSGFQFLAACGAVAALTACGSGGLQTSVPNSIAARQSNAGSAAKSVGIEFDNSATETIHPDGYTHIGCPWAVTQPPYPVSPGGSQHTVLVYNSNCTPNEPLTWSVAYGTKLSHKATICMWTVSNTAAAGFTYSVSNGARTQCTFKFSDNLEHFYYDSRARN